MELNRPLEDWELGCLAEKLSPMEFDQISVQYLHLKKVRCSVVFPKDPEEHRVGSC